MCGIKNGHDYSRDARREMNGDKSGGVKAWDLATRVFAGVVTVVIVSLLIFGVRVYAFMSAGDRFTPEMHNESVDKAWVLAREEFVQSDVYERDREYLKIRLDRIEGKLDKIIEQHARE